MNKQLGHGASFGVIVASMFLFTVIAGIVWPYGAMTFLGSYIAYLLFQLMFFHVFRRAYKSNDRGLVTLLVFASFAAIPSFAGLAARNASASAIMFAPVSALVVFTGGWWIYFSAHRRRTASGIGNSSR